LFATGTTAPFFRAKKSNGFSAHGVSAHTVTNATEQRDGPHDYAMRQNYYLSADGALCAVLSS
jgi:hypothetical protein